MKQIILELWNRFRKGDMVLLGLCLLTAAYGCLVIASATYYTGSTRYLLFQGMGIFLGVVFYAMISLVDADTIGEHRVLLTAFNCLILLLLIPFGTDNNTGNKSWLAFPFLPMDIQPAEFCKITFVLIMASVMASHQDRVSSLSSVIHMAIHLGIIAVLNMVLSGDLGVTLIFAAIFAVMAFVGGVKWYWFALAISAVVVATPVIWPYLEQHQKNRILVLFDPSIDPDGLKERWHWTQSLLTLNGGGMTGQGLFSGNRTQVGALFAQHTDFIFSAIGEELGYLGCMLTLTLLGAIILRCIYVGTRSRDYMRRMICFGVAGVLVFQVVVNVGMCLGVMPVIGLTLPFISYGGSSIMSLFAMLGLVSGVYARPEAQSHERYIRPPLQKI